ncbi:MAG TPA: hypothetical protein PLS53_13035 [Thermoanaerobaculaceae bacterium]|nr:hypothetical protein [Thermoanaerobaculaceae bacterium]HPS79075.1 hypothetical protein [Thermoanaerobaculaceae bacterium]
MSDDLFAGVRPIRPSPALRARVLAAARVAAERPAWWRALGFRRWDLVWVGAVLVLVVANVATGSGDRPVTVAARPARNRDMVALMRELGVSENAFQAEVEPVTHVQADALMQHILDERI